MHESVPSAPLAGEVLLNGEDIYAPASASPTPASAIGMVFQKPNPFPAMTIGDNVVAGLKLTGRAGRGERRERRPGRGLPAARRSVGRGQGPARHARRSAVRRAAAAAVHRASLAVNPDVLLMDEPCSALDPTSTRRIEETIAMLRNEVTIVIVTHNMQQAARVSQQCAFFLAEQGTPGPDRRDRLDQGHVRATTRSAHLRLRQRPIRVRRPFPSLARPSPPPTPKRNLHRRYPSGGRVAAFSAAASRESARWCSSSPVRSGCSPPIKGGDDAGTMACTFLPQTSGTPGPTCSASRGSSSARSRWRSSRW